MPMPFSYWIFMPPVSRRSKALLLNSGPSHRETGGRNASYVSSFADAVNLVTAVAEDGDMILTLGAGSVSQLGPMILDKLKEGANAIRQ